MIFDRVANTEIHLSSKFLVIFFCWNKLCIYFHLFDIMESTFKSNYKARDIAVIEWITKAQFLS